MQYEADHVIRAKQRIERDVRGFIQTGLAAEHHRVGELLKQIFNAALDVDWQQAAIRDAASVLPPVSLAIGKIPAVNRLMVKEIKSDAALALDYEPVATDLADVEASFWQALDGLDRQEWYDKTRRALTDAGQALSLGELAAILPPPAHYDMEAIALWLEMARFADAVLEGEAESFALSRGEHEVWQFSVPRVQLAAMMFKNIDFDDI